MSRADGTGSNDLAGMTQSMMIYQDEESSIFFLVRKNSSPVRAISSDQRSFFELTKRLKANRKSRCHVGGLWKPGVRTADRLSNLGLAPT